MKKIIIIASLFVGVFSFAQTKKEKIEAFLQLTNSANMGIQMASQFLDSFKNTYPDVPNEFWEEIKKEMKPEDIENMIIPIYEKHFTEKEIDDFIAFYNTPSGKKMIEKMPIVFQESQAVGQEWGRGIAKKVFEKISKSSKYQSPPPPSK
ncbi:DUF2059 domain-containing protein [uncultured Chryseobacterium sp.]|uniref:DUF2059 domain-containing protein n=1 Tax=uncultured Chryseobacterium sp. TaxID=259322 RepID=UPI00260B32BB|nr:DUF2059 domain-containing protein [uncultured Chryseobacterium sp.]